MTTSGETLQKAKKTHLSHPKYRPDIDGLRAIAVLSVVAFHAFPASIQGGFVGVDIFFVISGFLISSIIFGSLEKNSFSFKEFYIRRVNRIFPALTLVLVATWAFGWFSLYADEYMQVGKHVAGGAAFLSNFVLLGEVGYFDNSAETKPLLHLWSLGIEEQFYLAWPLMVWAAWKFRINGLILILLVGGASFALNISDVKIDPVATFYSPQTRFWELLVGSLLAYLVMFKPGVSRSLGESNVSVACNFISTAGMILIIGAFALTTKNDQFPGWWAVLPTVGTALIIAAGPNAWLNRTLLSTRALVWIGLISFPLYLWHWPILTFARIINSGVPPIEVRTAAIAVSIGLAWLTYRILEIPLRNTLSTARAPALLVGMVAVGAAGYMTYSHEGIANRAVVTDARAVNDQFIATTGWKYARNETCLNRYQFADASTLPWWFCSTNRDEPPSIVILGNSYANHLYPGIIHAVPDAVTLSIGTCDPGDSINSEVLGNPCSLDRPKRQNEFIDDVIKKSNSVKTVIISGLSWVRDDEYTSAFISRISSMEKMGIKVVIFVPHLMLGYNPRACFARPFKTPDQSCQVPAEERQRLLDSFARFKGLVSEKVSSVLFFDQNDTFCSDGSCSLVIDDLPAFRDEYFHYSEYASDQVGKRFVDWAEKNGVKLM